MACACRVGGPGAADVSDEEREQRKEAARTMERALLHRIRFDSNEEEMAWLKEKAAEDGVVTEFEAWLEEGSLDTPEKVWKEWAPSGVAFIRKLGPRIALDNMALLTSLPDGLHVGVGLDLEGCTGLTSLPDGLHVGGSLCLTGCTGLTSLQTGLHVDGDLNLEGCTGLTSLPDDLHVGGSLCLIGCTGLTSLPDGLYLSGDLVLAACTGLTSLPDVLHVDDDLFLDGCTGLTSLPGSLCVGGGLIVGSCTSLSSLPDGLHVERSLFLDKCTALKSLPGGLRVGKYLNLEGCTGLTSLPNGLQVGGRLNLMGCTSLASLPDGLRVGGDLFITDRADLTSLPDDLHVGCMFHLQGCTGLASLPDGLHVGGDLYLARCTGLTSLPDSLHVDGDLDLTGCTGCTSLPDSVIEWGMRTDGEPRNFFLAGSGLPPEELARLQALNNPALRFHVSIDDAEEIGGAGLGADVFPTLDAAAAFWVEEAGYPSEVAISPCVEPAYVRGVLEFLSKLRCAKEFNNSRTKEGLAKRVVQVLKLLTVEHNGVHEELQVCMADAVDTCSDKPMWALNQMQLLVHTCKARGDRTKLRALGMGVMRLEVVHKHVRKAMDDMNFVDDVCVYLRFEIALRESLQLPVSALEMLFPSFITVTQKSIDAAEAEALALTDEDLEAWLPAWSEWQRQDRVEFAEKLDFSALKRNSTERLDSSLRSVLGHEVADPVRLKPLPTVWSLQDLLKHWVNSGMDLNNTPRDVDYMRLGPQPYEMYLIFCGKESGVGES